MKIAFRTIVYKKEYTDHDTLNLCIESLKVHPLNLKGGGYVFFVSVLK